MIRIKVIGRAGSTYMKEIREQLGNLRIANCHAAINWGLQGDKKQMYFQTYPAIQRLPILNDKQFGNKYACVEAVLAAGVPAPETSRIPDLNTTDGWIAKPYYSLGGRDIFRLRDENGRDVAVSATTHYAQKEITNRRYEMRVHCAAWIDPKDWVFQKRVHEDGENQLTWNHHTGGKFVTVNEPTDPLHDRIRKSVQTIMRVLGYSFGAVDFIIQNPGERGQPLKHFFIEFNLAPGWTLDRIRDWYYDTFKKLEQLTVDDIHFMREGARYTEERGFELDDLPHRVAGAVEVDERLVEAVEDAVVVDRGRVMAEELPMDYLRRVHPDIFERVYGEHEVPPQPQDALAPPAPVDNDDARFAELMEEAAVEANFCHMCGRGINVDIFGALPRFCPGCGAQVRA